MATLWTNRTGSAVDNEALSAEDWSFIHQCLSESPDRSFAARYNAAVRQDEDDQRNRKGRLAPSSWDPTPIPPATLTQLKSREGLLEKLLADGVVQPKRPVVKREDLSAPTFSNELKSQLQGVPDTSDLTIDVTMASERYVRRGTASRTL